MAEAYDEGVVSEVIRPAAIVPEEAARAVLVEPGPARRAERWRLAVGAAGCGACTTGPGTVTTTRPAPRLIGTIQVAYGTPTKYEITIYRVTVTRFGVDNGWTVTSLTDAALEYGEPHPRRLPPRHPQRPPRPFRF
ncbi:hypothetical protein GCM10025868_45950 [Angustibacter aerolatus]|uniref:Uncharacterized protein n=1 Tax=Angustibacter aerolatus TaxID=1162965 RepID=A0ABQ6JQ08_9ACTN|nr:hypothetical protein GCM10025868_45950 [Angustibacter aerolatus]